MRLYLGYDGSFVLSKSELVKDEFAGNFFLAPLRGKCADIDEHTSAGVFQRFKLKKFDVVVLDIKTSRPKTARKTARKTRP